jgi:hypothetical protein
LRGFGVVVLWAADRARVRAVVTRETRLLYISIN